MNKTELDSYRQRLLEERQRLQTDVNQMVDTALRPSDELSKTPIHIADQGTDTYSQELALSLMPNEEQVLESINHALDRIQEGTYGSCEQCEQPIASASLEALPYATLCIRCAQSREQRSAPPRKG